MTKKAYVFTPFLHRNTQRESRQDCRISDNDSNAYLSEKIYKKCPGEQFSSSGHYSFYPLVLLLRSVADHALYGHHRRDVFVWRKLGAKGKQENEEICERTI